MNYISFCIKKRYSIQQRILIGLALSCLTNLGLHKCSKSYGSASLEDTNTRTEIYLDFRPFTSPISTFLLLHRDGQVRVVNYNPYLLIVTNMYKKILPEQVVDRLFDRIKEPDFREPLQLKKMYGGNGLSRGDQFHILVRNGGTEECFGFVPDAPPVVSTLIEELLVMSKQFEEMSLADAYLRSKSITKEYLKELRRKETRRFIQLNEFPSDVQPIIIDTINYPGNFYALNRTQYEQLITGLSQGNEIFIVADKAFYQVTLYHSNKRTLLNNQGGKK